MQDLEKEARSGLIGQIDKVIIKKGYDSNE